MARLPSRREGDLLAGSLDALLQPRLLGGVRHVDVLKADRVAIGAAQDRHHLVDARELEAEHAVDEDLAVVIGLGEAVGRGVQFLEVLGRREAQGVELGVEVAAGAIGADHRQRAQRILGAALHVLRRVELDGRGLAALGRLVFSGLGTELAGDDLLDGGPIAVERRDEFAVGGDRPVRRLPGRPVRACSTAPASSPSDLKNSRHSGSTEAGSAR